MAKKKAKKQASSKKKRSSKRVRVLPRKMSSLIKIALADMRKVEANKGKFLKEPFYRDMTKLAKRLEKAGL